MRRTRLSVEMLEDRKVPAVLIEVGFGTLTVFGDSSSNDVVISRDELGVISVNGEVPLAGGIPGGFPSIFNTREITVFGAGGDDVIRLDEANGPLPSAVFFGGSGNDLLMGGSSDDILHGQSGDDTVLGGGGDDLAFLGSGDDVFIRGGSDGRDRVEGQSGADLLRVEGSDAGEAFELSTNEGRIRLTHDAGVADASGFERVAVQALGGEDTITVNPLIGAGVAEVLIDLGASPGGVGDGAGDAIVVNGTEGIDVMNGGAGFGEQVFFARGTTLRMKGYDGPTDLFQVNGLGEHDDINVLFFTRDAFRVVIDGGASDDSITGTTGSDLLIGGDGNDNIRGSFGDDTLLGGAGNDVLLGNAGDDFVDGGDGFDLLNGFTGDDVLLNGEIVIDE